jgi:uncharacterized radical SAM protein YgiQ
MEYDVILVSGERYFDHPLCGMAILKRLLEKYGYSVGIIEMPQGEKDVAKLGKPRLFFGVSSGAMDSMIRNYTALNRKREKDKNLDFIQEIPDRALLVYSKWIKRQFADSIVVIGGIEASLRRFTHYDYWENKIRKSILLDSGADILVYGNGEKQILEIASRLNRNLDLFGINGTCIKSNNIPPRFIELPSYKQALESKEKFCDMQNLFSNNQSLAQKYESEKVYVLQFKSPNYLPRDLDEYYELPFTREIKSNELKGFEFSIVTHRGCIGNCNFCSLRLLGGDKIVSRTEDSIIKEVERIVKMSHFKRNIDDLGGPSANMYGMDCHACEGECITCGKLNKSQGRLIKLMKKLRSIKGVKKVFVRSGIRYDLVNEEYLSQLVKHHVSGKLKIAPEHVNADVLALMNKDKSKGNLSKFIADFNKIGCGELAFYFMIGHPGTGMKESQELEQAIKKLKNAESVQLFTPTPMTVSTCMYYTGLDPRTKKKIYVPYSFKEKKEQKRILGLKKFN